MPTTIYPGVQADPDERPKPARRDCETLASSGSMITVQAPDELSGFLLQDRLAADFRCELVPGRSGWEVRVRASGPTALAAVLGTARSWLGAERISATTIVTESERYVVERAAVN